MARFCTRCGRPLEEGEVCTCQQDGAQTNSGQVNAQGQQPYSGQVNAQGQQSYSAQGNTQGQQMSGAQNNAQGGQTYNNQGYAGQGGQYYNNNQGYAGQGGQFTEQAGQMMNQFVSTSKNLFGRLVPMIKRPATELGAMAENEETSLGIQMIVLHLAVTLVMTIVYLLTLKSQLGVMAEYMEIPYVKIVLLMLILTAVVDFGLAAILFVVTKFIFKSELGFGGMLPLVGGMAVVNSAAFVVGGILMILSAQLGFIIIVVGAILGFLYMLGGYFKAVDISEDAKVYALFISYVVFMLIVLIVTKVLLADAVDQMQAFLH